MTIPRIYLAGVLAMNLKSSWSSRGDSANRESVRFHARGRRLWVLCMTLSLGGTLLVRGPRWGLRLLSFGG